MRKRMGKFLAFLISLMMILGMMSSTIVSAQEAISDSTKVEELIPNKNDDVSSRSGILEFILKWIFGNQKVIIDPTYNLYYDIPGKTGVTVTYLNEGNITGVLDGELRLVKYSAFLGRYDVVGKASINRVILGRKVPYSRVVFPVGNNKDFDYLEYDLTVNSSSNTSLGTRYERRISKDRILFFSNLEKK